MGNVHQPENSQHHRCKLHCPGKTEFVHLPSVEIQWTNSFFQPQHGEGSESPDLKVGCSLYYLCSEVTVIRLSQ